VQKKILVLKKVLNAVPFFDSDELLRIVQYLLACGVLYVVYLKTENQHALWFLIVLIIAEGLSILKGALEHVTEKSSDWAALAYVMAGLLTVGLATGVTLTVARAFALSQ